MGPQKYKNEQICVGDFFWKRAVGAKRAEMFPKKIGEVCVFFVTTYYGNEAISVGAHKKKHRPTKLFTPFEALYKTRL